ncbi:MAG: NIPSNAP family protein [Chloroflexi bacterium]|nr:NIPSNAP family protein [Chloroflexota bacterium]
MTVEVHVEGRVAQGKLAEFAEGVARYASYARDHGYVVPRVLQGLSGPMNTIRLVYTYDDLSAYEEHEARTLRDTGYAQAASGMGFVDGTLIYTVYRQVD